MPAQNSCVILIIEDCDEDYYIVKRGLEKVDFTKNIFRCVDGEDALNYLYHEKSYSDNKIAPVPNVIFLDLNLPKKNGIEVLKKIKTDENLRTIPVIVLTTSGDDRDISASYASGASSYIQKPLDINLFMEAIQRIKYYWFDVVILPK